MRINLYLNAGELLVHAHCYLHRPNLVPFGHRLPCAPHYFLKLKSAEALVQVSHEELLLRHLLSILWHRSRVVDYLDATKVGDKKEAFTGRARGSVLP